MPFSAELGMNVYDPQQAYASGQPAGRTLAQSFLEAPQREGDQLKVKALRDEIADRAKETQLQQLGMSELQDAVASGTPFKDAFFKAAPKLFSRNPEALGRIMHNQALEEAKASYNASLAESRIANLELRANIAASDQERKAIGQQIDLLKMTQAKELATAKLEAAQNKQTPQKEEREDFAKLQRQKDALTTLVQENPGRGDLKRMLNDTQVKIAAWEAQHPGGQQMSLTTDAQGNVQVQMGKGLIQPGAQSKIQGELADLKNSVVQIDQARNAVTEKDVGIPGVVWDELVNKYVSQIADESGDPSVSANRVQLQKAVDSYLQTQTAKGRLSAAERADIRDALVSRKAGESLPRARAVLDTMARIQKFDAITKAKTGRQPLEAWMFQGLSQTEIRQLMKEGVLTSDEAITWAKRAIKR